LIKLPVLASYRRKDVVPQLLSGTTADSDHGLCEEVLNTAVVVVRPAHHGIENAIEIDIGEGVLGGSEGLGVASGRVPENLAGAG
jgi:hypothetical protein